MEKKPKYHTYFSIEFGKIPFFEINLYLLAYELNIEYHF